MIARSPRTARLAWHRSPPESELYFWWFGTKDNPLVEVEPTGAWSWTWTTYPLAHAGLGEASGQALKLRTAKAQAERYVRARLAGKDVT